jgi:hypothetical protein
MARYGELSGVVGEAAISLATVKRWCQPFKAGNFSLDGENRPGPPLSDLAQNISQFLRDESFLSGRILAKRLTTRPYPINEIVLHDLGIKIDAKMAAS